MRFATLEDAGALYGDPACTQHMDFLQYYYAAKQRVVVLADLGDVKQVAVYGYGAYVKAEKLSGLSEEYDRPGTNPPCINTTWPWRGRRTGRPLQRTRATAASATTGGMGPACCFSKRTPCRT